MVQAIQQTSKRWKRLQGCGCLTAFAGMIVLMIALSAIEVAEGHKRPVAGPYAMAAIFFGTLAFVVGRVGIEWYRA